jgi:hypothetical protein
MTEEAHRAEVPEPRNTDQGPSVDSGFFRALMAYYIHQNQLMWSRVQILIAIQAGVLGGAYTLRKLVVIDVVMLVFGALLTVFLLFMMRRDEQIRDANIGLLESMARSFSGTPFQLRPPPSGPARFRASVISRFAFYLFIVVDIVVALLLVFRPDVFGSVAEGGV